MKLSLFIAVVLTIGCNRTGSPVPTPPPATVTPTVTQPPPTPTMTARSGKWESLLGSVDAARNAIAGTWTKADGGLRVTAAQGARLSLPVVPPAEYDFRVSFTRQTGVHSIALIFPHGTGRAAFEVDAWGQHLSGLQNINNQTIQQNPTRRESVALRNGQRYTMTLEVRAGQVRGFLDDQLVLTHRTDGSDLTLSNLWELPNPRVLALGAWESDTLFHSIELREVGDSTAAVTPAPPPMPTLATREPPTRPTPAAKRVLIVVANHHFFYREYGDPRAELERAGVRVTVAAGAKAACRPHPGSGQGADGGVVQADVALADVKADDYDAILFSGGWGSSAYQYAFTGRYTDATYNGTPAVKDAANRVINDFISMDKYVCALCNGVTVLAWARVDGKSPLQGKRVCAPVRQAAPGVYNGQPAQPSCRWHPEQNGAILSPAGSIGRPNTADDDVLVDGKIVTGEDDVSAREMGRRIVALLAAK